MFATYQIFGHEKISLVEGNGQRVEPRVLLDGVGVEPERSDHQVDEVWQKREDPTLSKVAHVEKNLTDSVAEEHK